MHMLTWFNVLALVGTAVGLAGGVINLRTLRLGKNNGPSLVAWKQPPASWRTEGTGYLVITIHALGTVLLGVLLLLVFNLQGGVPDIPFLEHDETYRHVYSTVLTLIAIFPLFFAGLNWGTALAFPLGSALIRPVPYAITETGVRYGRVDLPWKYYSHCEYDLETGMIRLFSASCPALANCSLMPPPELTMTVIEHIRRNLPGQPPLDVPWQRSPRVLVAGMSLLMLAFLLPGLWLVRAPAFWLYYPVALYLFADLGMRLINRFDPTGNATKEAAQAEKTAAKV
jgi:hypothetical protein